MRTFLLALLITAIPLLSNAWGREGHQIIACIADDHLTSVAKKNLQDCLGNTTIEEASTWMDEQRGDHSYDYMKPWHYINIEKGQKYDPASKDNIIWALNKVFSELEHRDKLTVEQARLDVMVLIHLMGDLQQPLHVGYGDDKGGNTMQVQYEGKGTNLHHVWDSDLIESQGITKASGMMAGTMITPEDVKHLGVKASDFVSYMTENRALLDDVYHFSGHKLSVEYALKNKPVIEAQLRNGGIHLATALNYLFRNDATYQKSTVGENIPQELPSPTTKVIYMPREAASHIGEEITVCGEVFGVKAINKGNGPTFINMGAPYPESPFTAVIFKEGRNNFSYKPEDVLDRKTICVTGKVQEYKGKVEIIVNSETQIKIQ